VNVQIDLVEAEAEEGDERTVLLWLTMPQAPAVGDTLEIRSDEDRAARTYVVLGVHWVLHSDARVLPSVIVEVRR
jgi:hypothetical protein